MSLSDKILREMKQYNWQLLIDLGPSLDDLNDEQWRFLKGLVIELATVKSSDNKMVYVGQKHKDFDWPMFNKTIELKSQMSGSFYKKNGKLRGTFSIKLNNSNGSNVKKDLPSEDVCDIILYIKNDGVCIIDKETVLKKAVPTGDGFLLNLGPTDLIQITGPLKPRKKYDLRLKEKVMLLISETLSNLMEETDGRLIR